MFSTTTIAAIAVSFLSTASAHLAISNPVPIPGSNSKSPLDPSGSNFPCQGADLSAGQTTSMAVGSQQPLQWDLGGGANWAVHGGGSCQISITYETNAAKLKDPANWKVLHSFIGGCPTNAKLNLDPVATACSGGSTQCVIEDYTFTVPPEVKNGNAILAWTWFNNVGNREMYMNCAKVSITGASGNLSGLPNMFTANIGNGCATKESFNTDFPNPGKYVTKAATLNYPLSAPSGSCGSGTGSASTPSDSGSSSDTSSSTPSVAVASSSAPASTPSVAVASGSAPASIPSVAVVSGSAPASTGSATSSGSDISGSGATGSSSSSTTSAASQSSSSPASNSNGGRRGRPSGGVFGEGAQTTSTSSPVPANTDSGSCGSEAVACSASGFYCIDSTHFGECSNGCAKPMVMAPGTSCTNNAVAHAVVSKRHANIFANFFARV